LLRVVAIIIVIIIIIKKRAITGGIARLILFAGDARTQSAADDGSILNTSAVQTSGLFAVRGCDVDAWGVVGPAFHAGVGVGIAHWGAIGAIAITCATITGITCLVTKRIA
jgi:hypothetical protein